MKGASEQNFFVSSKRLSVPAAFISNSEKVLFFAQS